MIDILLQNWIIILIVAVVSYLIGSINPAIIITRLALHKDIRGMGSGNAGFTNVLRSVGKGPAVMTIFFDFLKGVFAAFLGGMIFTSFSSDQTLLNELLRYGSYTGGLFVILGHMFPVYFKFKGGKGVTTAAAVMLVTDIRVFGMIILTFGFAFIITRIISLSSLISAILYPVYTFFFLYVSDLKNVPEGYVPVKIEYVIVCTVFTAVIAILVIAKHHANIVRIIKGQEKKIEPKNWDKEKSGKKNRKGRRLDPKDIHK